MANAPAKASADAELSFCQDGPAAIQRAFDELLNREPAAVVDAMRDAGGHVVLNADDLFKQWPQYRRDSNSRRWLGPILYGVARNFTDKLFAELLEKPSAGGSTVVFTAGGGASGKSTILRAQADRPEVDFVVDTTFSNMDRAVAQIDKALAAGRLVEINYVFRDFKEALRGMIERAQDPNVGRVVPVDDMARTHFGAQETIFAVLDRYADEPRVAVRLWKSSPVNAVKPLTMTGLIKRQLPAVDVLQKLGQTILDEIFGEAGGSRAGQREDLSGDKSLYEAARSQTQKGIPDQS